MGYTIRISAKGLFFSDKNEVLLIKGIDGIFWAAPGGGLEDGENAIEAVLRELTEETGFIGKVETIVFAQDFVNHIGIKQLEIFFKGKIAGQAEQTETDHEWQFFNQAEFKKIEFKPSELNPFALGKGVPYKPIKS